MRVGLSRGDWLVLAFLAVTALATLGPGLAVTGLGDPDEAAHAMDGVLIHDWVAGGPSAWWSPMEFARRQYGQYPTLGIGRHYPPGFAMIEAGFFALFGVSVAVAKVSVLVCAFAAAAGLYFLARGVANGRTAALAGMLFLVLPATTTWGRQIMLEAPVAAAAVWAGVAFVAYVRRPRLGRLLLCMALALAAIGFKQTAVFVIGAITVSVGWSAWRRCVPFGHAVCCVAASLVALGLVVVSLDEACAKTLRGYDTFADRWGLAALTFYVRSLPELTGWIVLALAVAGMAPLRKIDGAVAVLLVAWLVLAYAMVTTASLKVPRFFYIGVVPVVIGAALGADAVLGLLRRKRLQRVAVVAGVFVMTWQAALRPIPRWPDYGPLVAQQDRRFSDSPILFSGLRDGDFVFAMRRHAAGGVGPIIRGSKLLYTCTAGPDLDFVPYVHSREELVEVVRGFAFPFVVVERENHVGTQQDEWLRAYLVQSGDYRRVASRVEPAILQGKWRTRVTLEVYELIAPLERTVEFYEIPMPRTGSPIRVDLRSFSSGRPGLTARRGGSDGEEMLIAKQEGRARGD